MMRIISQTRDEPPPSSTSNVTSKAGSLGQGSSGHSLVSHARKKREAVVSILHRVQQNLVSNVMST